MRLWATTNSPPFLACIYWEKARCCHKTDSTYAKPERRGLQEGGGSGIRKLFSEKSCLWGDEVFTTKSLPTSVFRSASPFQNVFVPFMKTLDSSRMWWFMVGIWRWKALRRWQFYLGLDEYLLDKRFKSVERLQECRAKIEIWVKNSDCFRKYLFMFHCYCCNKYI